MVLALRHLCLYLATVDVLLERQQYLVGVDGLDKVVGNLLSDGLFHDVLFLALGNHDHGQRGMQLLDALESLQTAKARHLLVKQY